MNRRDFLLSSASFGAAMTARSYGQVVGANDRVQAGVIGAGRRGTIVSAALLRDSRARIVSVSDVYDEQTAQFLSHIKNSEPSPESHIAYEDLLARKDIDAVVIATPDHLHLTVAKAALSAAKHVYLEKPTLHRWDERKTLTQAAEGSGRVLQCGMQQRSGAHYLRAKQEIFSAGRLGKILLHGQCGTTFRGNSGTLQTSRNQPDWTGAKLSRSGYRVPGYETIRYTAWRYFPEYGAGLLADILTHWVDVAQWMLDDAEPQMASAFGGIYQAHDGRKNPDTVSAIVQYREWNLNFESSVLSIRDDRPSVFFEGTEGHTRFIAGRLCFHLQQGRDCQSGCFGKP